MAKVQPEEAGADANPAATIKWTKESAPVAAREKGGDPDTNFSLRMAIDKAKDRQAEDIDRLNSSFEERDKQSTKDNKDYPAKIFVSYILMIIFVCFSIYISIW